MLVELLPFICGALLARWSLTILRVVAASFVVGAACAALANELSGPISQSLVALAVDSLAATAGYAAAHFTIRAASHVSSNRP